MQETLNFDVTLKEIPVILKKDGTENKFILREFDGATRKDYLGGVMEMVNIDIKTSDDNKPTVGISSIKDPAAISGIKSSLIALCLFSKIDNELKPVTAETILTYPVKTIDGLYEACQKLNGLGASAEAIAKNELEEKPEDG